MTSQTPGRGVSAVGEPDGRETRPGPELTPLGPCPTCGQQRHRIAHCVCGHMVFEHSIGASGKKAGVRTACTNGLCGCRGFEEAPDGVS